MKREDLLINMTPMIDVMIFLIVFFLAATNFAEIEREQDIHLPVTRGVGSLSKTLENKIIINVKKDGTVFVLGRKYETDELRAYIASRHASLKDALKVELRADKRTLHGDVARVLAMVREAGVLRPAIDTKQVTLEP